MSANTEFVEAVRSASVALSRVADLMTGSSATTTSSTAAPKSIKPRGLPSWRMSGDKQCLFGGAPGNRVTIMADRFNQDQICLLFSVDGQTGVEKYTDEAEAKRRGEELLGYTD